MDHGALAREYFLKGYNCSQAVLLAFSDLTGLDEKVAVRLASSFGGGMGRMREVCGTVSGALMVLGILYGYDAASPNANEEKTAHYARVQEFAGRFREEFGSIICREILANHVKRMEAEKAEKDAQRRAEKAIREARAQAEAIVRDAQEEAQAQVSAAMISAIFLTGFSQVYLICINFGE